MYVLSGIPPGFPFPVIPDISHAPGELTNSSPRHSPGTFACTRTLTTSLAPGRYLVAHTHPVRFLRTRVYTPTHSPLCCSIGNRFYIRSF